MASLNQRAIARPVPGILGRNGLVECARVVAVHMQGDSWHLKIRKLNPSNPGLASGLPFISGQF